MDTNRFDDLLRALTASPSRRGIARAVAGFALAGPLGVLLGLADVEAKRKKGKPKNKKKCKGGTKKCGKKCIAATSCCSAADCGNGGACAGGTCICATGFKSCHGTCIPDSACCAADCGPCESCQGAACVLTCQADQECVGGQCRCTTNSCDGCCDGDTCRNGNNTNFCGIDGESCDSCVGSEICQGGNCVCLTQCCSDAICGPGNICVGGQCVTGQGTCPTGADICISTGSECAAGSCLCFTTVTGQTRCAEIGGPASSCGDCDSDAECAALFPGIPGIFCNQAGPHCCGGVCKAPCPF